MKKAKHQEFDIVIIGGAMTGATLALAINHLTKGKQRIALIEASPINHDHKGFDARSIALSFGSCALLNEIELWKPLEKVATPINHIHVSDKGHAGINEFNAVDENLDFLGQVIELADAGQIYYQKLNEIKQIELFCPAQVEHIEKQQDYNIIKLNDGQMLSAKLVVAADGGLSQSCKMMGITRSEHDFNQVAIIANIISEKPHANRAFERFTQNGPVALLPMTQDKSSLVWCVDPKDVDDIMSLTKEEFLARLQQEFGWRLGRLKQSTIPHSYPLILRQADKLIAHRFVVVGNAAQTLHPIAGQGFNLAFRDVMTLAKNIAKSVEEQKDIGDMSLLQNYRKQREEDRDSTIALISSLVYGFSNQSLALTAARNIGLMAMSNFKLLKAPLLQHMLGLVKKQNV